MVAGTHVDQQVTGRREHALQRPHVALCPVELRRHRLQIQISDAPGTAVSRQERGLGPPSPPRALGVRRADGELHDSPIRGEGVGGERLGGERHHHPLLFTDANGAMDGSNTSLGTPARPEGRGSALSRLAGVFATRKESSFSPACTSPVTSTTYGSHSLTPAGMPLTSTSTTSSRIGMSRNAARPAASPDSSSLVRYVPRPE